MLKVGSPVPDFSGAASDGTVVSKSSLAGKPFVIFFYPKSFTSTCTVETRHFALLAPKIRACGAELVGVSIDSLDTQCQFAAETGADFPILADPDAVITKRFELKRPLVPLAKRATFVVDEAGVIEAIVVAEFSGKEHADKVLEHLKARSVT